MELILFAVGFALGMLVVLVPRTDRSALKDAIAFIRVQGQEWEKIARERFVQTQEDEVRRRAQENEGIAAANPTINARTVVAPTAAESQPIYFAGTDPNG